MDKEIGQKEYDIWLLGDSNPKNWANVLSSPFDARHPIRHNIITPIFDRVQESLYQKQKLRFKTSEIYIRNSIENPDNKPKPNIEKWNGQVVESIYDYQKCIKRYKPKMLFSFGSFSFEFARRCLNKTSPVKYGYWDTKKLGEQFRESTKNFNIDEVNLIPLLHRSISGGQFLQSHKIFCNDVEANYFNVVGDTLAQIMIKNKESLKIWCNAN